MKYLKISLFLLLPLYLASAQDYVPGKYRLRTSGFDTSAYRGMKSNMVSEVRLQGDSLVWIGTSVGLAVVRDSTTVYTLKSSESVEAGALVDNLPAGAVSAIAVSGDTLFSAFARTTDGITSGRGLTFSVSSRDSSITWTYFNQPVDVEGDSLAPFAKRFFKALPVTVEAYNITYDAAMSGGYVWITSWAGGLRRYNIAQNVWERVPLPLDSDQSLNTCEKSSYIETQSGFVLKDFYLNPRDPWDGVSTQNSDPLTYGNHNHKAFSVLAYGDTVWVGTANGINRGIVGANGCVNWSHYTVASDGLTGNFVVALGKQDFKGHRVIWASTVTSGAGETSGVSYTIDDGVTWYTTLVGERAYNISTADSLVFVSTDNGLWKFKDDNPLDIHKPWALFKPAKQAILLGTGAYQTDQILNNRVIAAAYDSRVFYSTKGTLWIGTDDGLGRTIDLSGSNWQIYRAEYEPTKVYAYPNPYSPYVHNILDGDGYVRFHTDVKVSFIIEMAIYNFGLEKVYEEKFDRRSTKSGALKWNGRDQQGQLVANGAYMVRLKYDNKIEWAKVIVVK